MVFQGSVTISLQRKDHDEFFKIYSTNFFGDYQLLMELKSTECYKSSNDGPTYTYCIKKVNMDELMDTFPDAKTLFTERAEARRIEMRRIRKQFETEYQVLKDEKDDSRRIDENPKKFYTKYYADNPDNQPEFLTNADYYFVQQEQEFNAEDLEEISDSEVLTRTT